MIIKDLTQQQRTSRGIWTVYEYAREKKHSPESIYSIVRRYRQRSGNLGRIRNLEIRGKGYLHQDDANELYLTEKPEAGEIIKNIVFQKGRKRKATDLEVLVTLFRNRMDLHITSREFGYSRKSLNGRLKELKDKYPGLAEILEVNRELAQSYRT